MPKRSQIGKPLTTWGWIVVAIVVLLVGGWFSRLTSPYPEYDEYPKAGTAREKAAHIALQPLASGIGFMGFLMVVGGAAIQLMLWILGLAFAWYFISEIFGL